MVAPTIVTDLAEGLAILDREEGPLPLDLETDSLRTRRANVAVVTMYAPQAHVVALFHVRGEMPPLLRDWLSRAHQFLGHNIVAYDALVLANHGVDIFAGQQWLDTMIAEQVLLPQGRRDFRKGLQKTLERRLRKTISKEF